MLEDESSDGQKTKIMMGNIYHIGGWRREAHGARCSMSMFAQVEMETLGGVGPILQLATGAQSLYVLRNRGNVLHIQWCARRLDSGDSGEVW